MTFPKSGTHPSSKKKKRHSHVKQLSYSINSVQYTPDTPLADLQVPDSYDEGTAVLIGCATVYLNSLTKTNNRSTRRHDKSLPCVICKQTGHDFDGCPALNDHDFLKSAVIKSSLYWANHAKLLAKSALEAKQQKSTSKISWKQHSTPLTSLTTLHLVPNMRMKMMMRTRIFIRVVSSTST